MSNSQAAPGDAPKTWRVARLDQREAAVALELHSLIQEAQAQESALLEQDAGESVVRSVADISNSPHLYLGVRSASGLLVGACSVGTDDEPGQLCIHVLVVHPLFQRRGVASAVLQHIFRQGPGLNFAVVAAQANASALALYTGLGFVPYRWGTMGPAELALVKLRRPARPDTLAGHSSSTPSS
ncbi:MAG: GNAT family N-acetyltransferase [Rubrivivax sp.]|nr:GNAT family N-acetyltransferase [Rubrivivax sp.]MDP3610700.1 GNAT family N-acetyltransferase [Rubrivivax sp.]